MNKEQRIIESTKLPVVPSSIVYNEDCVEGMKRFSDNHFDLAIVDPPYGLGESVVNSGGRFKRYYNKNGNWDMEVPTDEYFTELFRVSKNQIIWGGELLCFTCEQMLYYLG